MSQSATLINKLVNVYLDLLKTHSPVVQKQLNEYAEYKLANQFTPWEVERIKSGTRYVAYGGLVIKKMIAEGLVMRTQGKIYFLADKSTKSKHPPSMPLSQAQAFQNKVASVLSALGYHISFVAPPGPDGGIDIICAPDVLNLLSPRIKVQVKNQTSKPIGIKPIRELLGLLVHPADVGLFVTSGVFSPDVTRFARNHHRILRLMDGKELNYYAEKLKIF